MSIKKFADEYGFEVLEIVSSEGGNVKIAYYGDNIDIGMVSKVNRHGLGGFEYIRNTKDVPRHIRDIQDTIWLGETEKKACIEFLEYIMNN